MKRFLNCQGGGTDPLLTRCLTNRHNKLQSGFTLAEVLVTLGIIGVVSAMTIPTLMQNHQRTTYVTQLHKVYNEVSQAALQVMADSNASSLQESKLRRQGSAYFLSNYFKTTITCSGSDTSDCFASDYTNMNGTAITLSNTIPTTAQCAVLASGAAICMNGSSSYTVVTDINGKAGPNILGRDLFSFILGSDGTVSTGDVESIASKFSSNCSSATGDAYGYCFAKILNDGWKMDY